MPFLHCFDLPSHNTLQLLSRQITITEDTLYHLYHYLQKKFHTLHTENLLVRLLMAILVENYQISHKALTKICSIILF